MCVNILIYTNKMNVGKITLVSINVNSNPAAHPDISLCLYILLCHLDAVK